MRMLGERIVLDRAVERRTFLGGLVGAGTLAAAGPGLAAQGASSGLTATLGEQAKTAGLLALVVQHKGVPAFTYGHTDKPVILASVRKSLISTLYGIAVDRGQIDISKTLGELGIDEDVKLTEAEKSATIENVLMARSGIYLPIAPEVGPSAGRPERGSHAPGTFWFYNNWDFNVLGNIYERLTHKDFFLAFDRELARPLGFTDFDPYRDCDWFYAADRLGGTPRYPYYQVRVSCRDQARLGQLIVQKGLWNGKRLLSEAWIDKATSPLSETGYPGMLSNYGYLWWNGEMTTAKGRKLRVISAQGNGGHSIDIIPELDVVAVITPAKAMPKDTQQQILLSITAEYGV